MRLWHIDLIHYLPKSQLIAQWRELNSIFKNQNKHILINYVYDYDKSYLLSYTNEVLNEMHKRSIKLNEHSFDNYNSYFANVKEGNNLKFKEHDIEYLTICYYNLKEKYKRGQKDFTQEVFDKLNIYYEIAKLNYKVLTKYLEEQK